MIRAICQHECKRKVSFQKCPSHRCAHRYLERMEAENILRPLSFGSWLIRRNRRDFFVISKKVRYKEKPGVSERLLEKVFI